MLTVCTLKLFERVQTDCQILMHMQRQVSAVHSGQQRQGKVRKRGLLAGQCLHKR